MRVRLKPFLAWARASERVLTLQGGGVRLHLEGAPVEPLSRLLPRLDGRPLAEAAEAAGVPLKDAEEMALTLLKRGALEDAAADKGEDGPVARWLAPWTSTPRRAAARLRGARAAVVGAEGDGDLVEEALALLSRMGVGAPARDPEGAAFVVLVEAAPRPDALDAWAPRLRGVAWTRVALDGAHAWVGPTRLPGHACGACLRARLRGQALRPATLDAHEAALRARPVAPAASPALAAQALALAAQEAALHLSGAREPLLVDRAMEVTPAEGTRPHPVLPVVGCPGCGGPPA